MNVYMKDAMEIRQKLEKKIGKFLCEKCWVRPAAAHSLRCSHCLHKFGPSGDSVVEGGYYFDHNGKVIGTY